MLSAEKKARIQRTLNMLENARNNCADSGIRRVIEAWIEEARKTLADDKKIETRLRHGREPKHRSSGQTG
jgi:hypothetical protein